MGVQAGWRGRGIRLARMAPKAFTQARLFPTLGVGRAPPPMTETPRPKPHEEQDIASAFGDLVDRTDSLTPSIRKLQFPEFIYSGFEFNQSMIHSFFNLF